MILRLFLWILFFASVLKDFSCYSTFYAEEECMRNETVLISLGTGNVNSSGIFKASRDGRPLPAMHCRIVLRPTLSTGVVVNVRYIDLVQTKYCDNYLEIDSSPRMRMMFCRSLYDAKNVQSYFKIGEINLILHMQNVNNSATNIQNSQFEIIFTAANVASLKTCRNVNETVCGNDRCIWKGLVNDRYINCGDSSDETLKDSDENHLSAGLTLTMVIPIIVGSLGLIVILVCCFGNRVTAKIERLIQNEERRNAARRNLVNSNETPLRQNYNTVHQNDAVTYGRETIQSNIISTIPYDTAERRERLLVPDHTAYNFTYGRVIDDVGKDAQLPPYEAPPSYETVAEEVKQKF